MVDVQWLGIAGDGWFPDAGLVLLVMDGFLTLRLVRCGNAGVCGRWWLWMLVVVDACGCRCLWLWMLVG